MLQGRKWHYAAARKGAPRAVCTLCAQEICAGETLWYCSGITVCADCLTQFARGALKPFEYILGEETEE